MYSNHNSQSAKITQTWGVGTVELNIYISCSKLNCLKRKEKKTFAPQCAQILQVIFAQSYVSGNLPEEWKKALVSPVFKKDDKSLPSNYRPISLTCISCKIMEHVLRCHLSNHLEINNILTPHQHAFQKGFSTETQLISVLDDWLSSLDKQTMTDVLLIDFSKAFDSVPHQRLLLKLNYYGITGNSLSWIEDFLLDRTQCVQVSGTRSSWISVTSGVPQGTVLGLLLFLTYISDIVHNLNSEINLFADEAVLYSEVSNVHVVSLFQQDLDTLSCWAAI